MDEDLDPYRQFTVVPAPEATLEGILGPPTFDQPVWVVALFLEALEEPDVMQDALHNLTTPESWAAWDGFTGSESMRAQFSLGTHVGHPLAEDLSGEIEDVAYVKLVPSGEFGEDSVYVTAGTPMTNVMVATLVWRPELAPTPWRIHQVGGDALLPEQLPRSV